MKLILLVLLPYFVTGCGTLTGLQSSYAPMVRVPELIPENLEENENIRKSLGEGLALQPSEYQSVSTFAGLVAEATPSDRVANRDIVIGYLLNRSDTLCNQYLGDITRAQRTWRSSFATMGLLFGTAGGIATPERSSKLLAALSGGMSGLSGKLDEGLLSNQAGHLIRAANIDLRQELRAELDASMAAGGDLAGLPLSLLVSHVQAYHSRCSVDDGLSRLNSKVSTEAES